MHKFVIWFKTTNLDVGRTLKGKFNCRDSKIVKHMNDNDGHVIPFSVFHLKSYKNAYELNIAFELKERTAVKFIICAFRILN